MNAFIHLLTRNNKLFRRDYSLVFFSLLSVIIVISLYVIFLQKMQLDSIEKIMPLTTDVKIMVNQWMFGGMLSILAVTTTLGAFSIYIRDIEMNQMKDFLTMPVSRGKIQLAYVANAMIVGVTATFLAYVVCQLVIVSIGGAWYSLIETAQLLAVLFLSVLLASAFNLFATLLVQSQSAFSTLNTIIGTSIGFLCGVYVPMGALPTFVQNIILFFPISHTTLALRELLMRNSIDKVFGEATKEKNTYELMYGIHYQFNHTILSLPTHLIIIVGSTIVFTLIALFLFRRKNKFFQM